MVGSETRFVMLVRKTHLFDKDFVDGSVCFPEPFNASISQDFNAFIHSEEWKVLAHSLEHFFND